ncbi:MULTISPECIES: ERF family protein [Halomonas]|uniref:ERF family protein n=1 Tax=Halomonas TaxID=2745 RepID=UPI001C947759|nr:MULTISPECIES: ERF family protein [Halomonas]MBY6207471.1 ERF family protein [Halomonas sp. DP3Y7-2]MBY6228280.1 ERF family protein [Halomonas sp. DP3Y7-1]MCA0916345.1 ERF family protein [Halomonas denitrificans]
MVTPIHPEHGKKSSPLSTHQTPQPLQESTAIIQVIERAALNPDVDIDKMERLLQMQERVLDRQAMMAYSAAMAAMQTELPSIAERGQGNNGAYATLEDIVDTVRPIMKQHGFAVSFRIQTQERGIQVTGVLMHKDGHREETSMLLPADTSGSKNAVQAFGSSTSYGKRYVLCALLNITTRGQDDNGHGAAPPVKVVTAFQAAQLKQLITACPVTTQEWFVGKYGDVERVPRSDFDKLRASLQKRALPNHQRH